MSIVFFKPSGEFKEKANKVFKEERNKILDRLPYAEVHHIAGTSIPGLVTKGDLDVNIRVKAENFQQSISSLKEMYEINQPNNWTENFASFKDDKNLDIDFGAQLTVIGSRDDHFLKHKEILLNSPELVKELNELKKKYEGKSMDEYREAKGEFFNRLSNN